jgi:hypothetical protein
VTVALGMVGVLNQDPASNPECPGCEALPVFWRGIAILTGVLSLAAVSAFSIGLLNRDGLPRLARIGLRLVGAGAPLLLLLGAGTYLIVPGLVLLGLGLRRTPLGWYIPAAILAASVLVSVTGATLDETSDPSPAVVTVTFSLVEAIGVAWAVLGLQVKRTGFPHLRSNEDGAGAAPTRL